MVSQNYLDALYPQNTADVILLLLTLEEPNLPGPQRFVRNTVDITSRGLPFLAYPFEITVPDDVDSESDAVINLSIDNVAREIGQAIQLATEPPQVTLEVVLASDPHTVERGPFVMEMRRAEFDKGRVTAVLSFQDLLDEPFPGYAFTPTEFPGLFG